MLSVYGTRLTVNLVQLQINVAVVSTARVRLPLFVWPTELSSRLMLACVRDFADPFGLTMVCKIEKGHPIYS